MPRQQHKLQSLSVFFPCFNEAENIPALLRAAQSVLPTLAEMYEIIIVDDGSRDDTVTVVESLSKSIPELRLVSHKDNEGYGAALKTGIQAAQYEWTFFMDGDQQFDIRQLRTFLPETLRYDAVIGYREHRADTFLRRVNGELYTQLINFLYTLGVYDIDCAFKLIRTRHLKNLRISSTGAFTSAEILINLQENFIKFRQLPVKHFERKYGKPTGGSLRVIFKGIKETAEYFLRSKFSPY